MSDPENLMPNGERRSQPPVSLDVIAYQVGALQTSVDRGLAGMERTIDRGLSELKIEVHGLSNDVAAVKEQLGRMDTRVEALEIYRQQEEDRRQQLQERSELRAEAAAVDQSQLRMWRWLGGGALGFVGIGGFLITLAELLGGK